MRLAQHGHKPDCGHRQCKSNRKLQRQRRPNIALVRDLGDHGRELRRIRHHCESPDEPDGKRHVERRAQRHKSNHQRARAAHDHRSRRRSRPPPAVREHPRRPASNRARSNAGKRRKRGIARQARSFRWRRGHPARTNQRVSEKYRAPRPHCVKLPHVPEVSERRALILPVGPMGMYRWTVYFLKEWGVACDHVHGFNMDEWSDAEGNTLPPDNPGAFQYAMEQAFYGPLGNATVPARQRHFALKTELPTYAEQIADLKKQGAKLVTVFGIGRVCHIAFWEPHFAGRIRLARRSGRGRRIGWGRSCIR